MKNDDAWRKEKNLEEKVVREVKDLRDQKDHDTGDEVPMIQKAICLDWVDVAKYKMNF